MTQIQRKECCECGQPYTQHDKNYCHTQSSNTTEGKEFAGASYATGTAETQADIMEEIAHRSLIDEIVKEFEAKMPPAGWIGRWEDDESENNGFGYKHLSGDRSIHEVTDWGNIKKFLREKLTSYGEARAQEGYWEGIKVINDDYTKGVEHGENNVKFDAALQREEGYRQGVEAAIGVVGHMRATHEGGQILQALKALLDKGKEV